MTTARHVVADDALTSFHAKRWELERRLREGTLDVEATCTGMQTLIEGGIILPDLSDLRAFQAFRLYDTYGIGEVLGYASFEVYLDTIPPVPAWTAEDYQTFDRVALVENRMKSTALCRALGVQYGGGDDAFASHDPKRAQTAPVYWMLFHDGRRNHNRTVYDCRTTFLPCEVGLNDIEGLCAYAQDRRRLIVENEHAMDLPGSVHRGSRGSAAGLVVCDGRPEIDWYGDDSAGPWFGSAARRE